MSAFACTSPCEPKLKLNQISPLPNRITRGLVRDFTSRSACVPGVCTFVIAKFPPPRRHNDVIHLAPRRNIFILIHQAYRVTDEKSANHTRYICGISPEDVNILSVFFFHMLFRAGTMIFFVLKPLSFALSFSYEIA